MAVYHPAIGFWLVGLSGFELVWTRPDGTAGEVYQTRINGLAAKVPWTRIVFGRTLHAIGMPRLLEVPMLKLWMQI